jgi:hypothetical protein
VAIEAAKVVSEEEEEESEPLAIDNKQTYLF